MTDEELRNKLKGICDTYAQGKTHEIKRIRKEEPKRYEVFLNEIFETITNEVYHRVFKDLVDIRDFSPGDDV